MQSSSIILKCKNSFVVKYTVFKNQHIEILFQIVYNNIEIIFQEVFDEL
jgi:hypothetical protein